MSQSQSQIIPLDSIESRVLWIRDQKVMLDRDLAELYGVETKALNQAVSRNIKRFPDDFMFQLDENEFLNLKSQIVTSSWGGRRKSPYVFTEHGILMLSSVLGSERAVQVNIAIMRAFVRMREMIASNKEFSKRIDDMEAKYDTQFKAVFDALRQLIEPPIPKKNPIGYIHSKSS